MSSSINRDDILRQLGIGQLPPLDCSDCETILSDDWVGLPQAAPIKTMPVSANHLYRCSLELITHALRSPANDALLVFHGVLPSGSSQARAVLAVEHPYGNSPVCFLLFFLTRNRFPVHCWFLSCQQTTLYWLRHLQLSSRRRLHQQRQRRTLYLVSTVRPSSSLDVVLSSRVEVSEHMAAEARTMWICLASRRKLNGELVQVVGRGRLDQMTWLLSPEMYLKHTQSLKIWLHRPEQQKWMYHWGSTCSWIAYCLNHCFVCSISPYLTQPYAWVCKKSWTGIDSFKGGFDLNRSWRAWYSFILAL